MPEYACVIDRGGLDTAIEWPGEKARFKALKKWATALKAAFIIHSFSIRSIPSKRELAEPPAAVERIQARLMKGITAEGAEAAYALSMMQLRASMHSSGDYIMIRSKMPESEFLEARKKDPYSGAIDMMMNAVSIIHGTKSSFEKWIRRMQHEKELAEE